MREEPTVILAENPSHSQNTKCMDIWLELMDRTLRENKLMKEPGQ